MAAEVRANTNTLGAQIDDNEFRKLADNIPMLCWIADAQGYNRLVQPSLVRIYRQDRRADGRLGLAVGNAVVVALISWRQTMSSLARSSHRSRLGRGLLIPLMLTVDSSITRHPKVGSTGSHCGIDVPACDQECAMPCPAVLPTCRLYLATVLLVRAGCFRT